MREEIVNLVTQTEFAVLEYLKQKSEVEIENKTIDLSEISSYTKLRDKDDVIRALYTLEGKSLVQPIPEGDFTSGQWQITEMGKKAFHIIKR